MGVGTGLVVFAVGAVLRFATSVTTTGFNIHAIGIILMIVGAVGFLLSLAFWVRGAALGINSQTPHHDGRSQRDHSDEHRRARVLTPNALTGVARLFLSASPGGLAHRPFDVMRCVVTAVVAPRVASKQMVQRVALERHYRGQRCGTSELLAPPHARGGRRV